ncbi:MAG: alginate lyase family protein [Candidatus Riflebacteria bacterium]
MANKIWFLISRLRNASLPELIHRVREVKLIARLRKTVRYGDAPFPVPSSGRDEAPLLKMPDVISSVSASHLQEYLGGVTNCLNGDAGEIKEFEERNRKTFFSNVGQEQGGPDIRAVWEPARLQHAMVLICHGQDNPGSEFAARCLGYAKTSILEWLERNPFLYGPHYKSIMECGLRVPVFFAAVKRLSLDEKENTAVFSAMYHHAWLIEKRLSLYSSLGNHTTCECVGLIFAGAIFRKSEEGKHWLARGIEVLEQELDHQVLPDGGPVEQSLSYHRFVLDLYWLAVDFLERNSLYDCHNWKSRLEPGERFLAVFQDAGGNLPSIGDSDDGYAIAPGVVPRRGTPQPVSGELIPFPDAGYTVIRSTGGMHLAFDHGPLGMPPLYNHGHADALSIILSVNGTQFLVDPGTYRYNGAPEYRKYFKGTRAHNTVTVDGLDQAVQETGFIWSKPFLTKLVRSEKTGQGILLEAVNDGYARLKRPVRHRRTIRVADEALLFVQDSFSGQGTHDFELNFHLHPGVGLEQRDGWWRMQRDGNRLDMRLFGSDTFASVGGQEAPLAGWYSPAYGIKEKSVVLRACKKGRPDEITFTTVISLNGPVNIEKLEWLAESA